MTSNPNPAGSHYQKCTAFECGSVLLKHGMKVFDFGLQGGSWKPKENDSGMGKFLVKNQLADVPISDDEHTCRFPRDGQDLLIRKARRIMARDGLNVMAKAAKVGNQSKVSALVEEEFHRAASERTPLGGFGETSLPVTISFA